MELDVIKIVITNGNVNFVRIPRGKENDFCTGVSETYPLSPKVEIKNALDCNEIKLNSIWKVINNALYFGDIKKRNFYNLIHEVAEIINPDYEAEDIGTKYLE